MTAIKIDEGQILRQIEGSPNGIASVYVRLDKKWGLKLFYDEHSRDYAYNLQNEAANLELGPKVGEKIDMSVDCERPFGYITEHVKVLPHYLPTDDSYDRIWANKNFLAQRKKLKNALENRFGIIFSDLHMYNMGWKNGKCVCIDFGNEGILSFDD